MIFLEPGLSDPSNFQFYFFFSKVNIGLATELPKAERPCSGRRTFINNGASTNDF